MEDIVRITYKELEDYVASEGLSMNPGKTIFEVQRLLIPYY